MSEKRWLRQAPSGDFYQWNQYLAARPDMVEIKHEDVPEKFGGGLKESNRKTKPLQAELVPLPPDKE
jgi:hypothetical protein